MLMFTACFACSLIAKCRIVAICYNQGSKTAIPVRLVASLIEKLVLNDLVWEVPGCDRTSNNQAVFLGQKENVM